MNPVKGTGDPGRRSAPGPGGDLLRRLLDVELLPFTAGCRCFETGVGRIVVHPALPVLYDNNLAILRRLPDVPVFRAVAELEAKVRPAFEAAGATHIRFIAARDLVSPLQEAFAAAGYRYTGLAIMVHRTAPSRRPDPEIHVRRVESHQDEVEFNLVDTEVLSAVPWGSDLIRAALRIRRREISEFLDFAWYVAEVGGETAGSVGLLKTGTNASIQEVSTRPVFRRRSVATTMVLRMVLEAGAAGCDTISLMTEAGSHAEGLYRQLGFSVAGYADSFLKDE